MTNLKHNRPYLKYIDNLRRVIAASDPSIKPACVLKVQKPTSISLETKPTRAPKESVPIEFYGNELALCSAFLNAVDSFFACSTEFFEGFFKKNSSSRQKNVEEAEANLRECIRELLFGYMQVIHNNDKKSGLHKFWKLLFKGQGKSGVIAEMIAQEMNAINEALDF